MRRTLQTLFILTSVVLFTSCASRKNAGKSKLSYDQQTRFDQLYFEASKLKVLGDYTASAKSFANALKIDPNSHAVMYQMANLNMAIRSYHEAIYWSERSVKNNPNFNYWYYGQLAQAYNKVQEYKKSAQTFEVMIEKEPDRKSNYTEAANQFINAQEFKSAINLLNIYEKKFRVDEESARKKEGLYFQIGKPKEGIEAMIALVNAYPSEARYKGLLAESYLRNNQLDEAQSTYEEILASDPTNGYAHFGLADVYRKKELPEKSFEHLLLSFTDKEVALGLKIKVVGSYYTHVRNDEKMRSQALKLCSKLIEVHPNESEVYIAYGDILYAAQEIESARENLLKATEIRANDISVWQKLLSLDDELGNFAYLVEDSKSALEYYPNHVFLYIVNGFANYALGNYEDAKSVAEEGLEISVIPSDRIDLLTTLADASHSLGYFEESDKAFEELLELDPENAGGLNNYAYYLSLRKVKLDKALVMILKALKSNPSEATYLDTHGWILFQQGKYEEALVILQKALAALPGEPDLMEHVGKALIKTGKTQEGAELISQAKDIRDKSKTESNP